MKECEFEIRLLDSNGDLVRVYALKANTERALRLKTSELVGVDNAPVEIRPLSTFRSPYHPTYSRLHKYSG